MSDSAPEARRVDDEGNFRNGGSRPVPDPTVLTDRAIAKLKEQVEDTLRERNTRFDEEILHARELAILRTNYERQISDIRAQAAEKLTARESELNALALAAALAAQKEAAGTQAATFGDALGALGRIVESSLRGLGDKVEDVKDRVGRIESVATGAITQRTEQRASTTDIRAWVAAGIGAVGFLILLADRLTT